jgi:hypothetical protein
MTDLASTALAVAQTVAIIGALVLTLYFSQKQVKAQAADLETRVLNDLDEKAHHLVEIFVQKPELIRIIYNTPTGVTPEVPASYYVQFMCSHIYHMRQRGILGDNEWAGWLAWMKNAFRYGTIGDHWKEEEMAGWFDPAFRDFVDRELLGSSKAA